MTPLGPSGLVDQLLASYPHVAACRECREYVDEYVRDHSPFQVLSAVLDHHDSAHTNDRLGAVVLF